ncbi:LacI family DNA-binding transcriptional regulator [Planococcus sp. X10-3]|uniref:LacI family DNA-binding transcriptional regulator n=1 Tax=Planococcus sp. X10-3 TaxID=3061240 RepID=UPI003BB0E1EC
MATIKEVAKQAGISVATVSRVLNGNGYVKESTREKVLQVIKEMDYVPNSIAISLNNKKTRTIGLLLPDITNPFFAELAKGVEQVAKEKGYTVILCNSYEDQQNEIEHVQMLEQKFIDGLIMASNTFSPEQLSRIKVPVVLIDRVMEEHISSVTSKNYDGAILAMNHLLDHGCKKIAHICGPLSIVTAKQRLQGYLDVAKEQKWFAESLIENGNYEIESGFSATIKLLQGNPDIDGIFAGNDLMAVGCLKALHSLKRKVPEEIAVIGFDGINFSKITIPELTTIAQPIIEMGLVATSIIIDQIEGTLTENVVRELEIKIIERESTKR